MRDKAGLVILGTTFILVGGGGFFALLGVDHRPPGWVLYLVAAVLLFLVGLAVALAGIFDWPFRKSGGPVAPDGGTVTPPEPQPKPSTASFRDESALLNQSFLEQGSDPRTEETR